MDTLKRKLSSTCGESITEVLISGLVIALGILMAVTMIVAATNIVRKASTSWSDYYTARNKVESRSSTATTGQIEIKGVAQMKVNVKVYTESADGTPSLSVFTVGE